MDHYHIIGVTESWLDMSNRDYIAEFQLSGYTIFSCERENRIGGGVILYIHSSLHPISIKIEPINGMDIVFIKLKNNSSRKILGLIYRPPARPAEIDRLLFESISETIRQCETIIMGDFNLPVTRWRNPLRYHTGHDLYTNLLESELHQHVHEPTLDLNTLDLILSTSKDLVSNVNVGPVFSSSDHRIITFSLKMKEIKVKNSRYQITKGRISSECEQF